jgi:hypothetical protein
MQNTYRDKYKEKQRNKYNEKQRIFQEMANRGAKVNTRQILKELGEFEELLRSKRTQPALLSPRAHTALTHQTLEQSPSPTFTSDVLETESKVQFDPCP